MIKTLLFICGPNGIGKTTICKSLVRRMPNSAYVDSEPCRVMNPSVLDDATIPTVAANIASLLRNYLLCPVVNTVIFSYGFHGRRREVFDRVMHHLAGVEYAFVPLLLLCDEPENVRRMRADGRDADRIQRALIHSRPVYEDLDYPQIDVTSLSIDEAVDAIVCHMAQISSPARTDRPYQPGK